MDFKTTLQQAVAHHQAGRLGEAERLYRLIADGKPLIGNDAKYYFEAVHNLGLVLAAAGRLDDALALLQRAVDLRPRDAKFRKNFAAILINGGRESDAERAFAEAERALELAPADNAALEMAAHAAAKAGKNKEGLPYWQKLALIRPDDATIHFNIGVGLQGFIKDKEAIAAYQRALQLQPGFPQAANNLAPMLDKLEMKVQAYKLMTELELAGTLADEVKPQYAALLAANGASVRCAALIEEIERLKANALPDPKATKPDIEWMINVAGALDSIGRRDEAVAMLERYRAVAPQENALSALQLALFMSQYSYPDDPRTHLERSRVYGKEFEAIVPESSPPTMEPLNGRPLRVGYVSGDLFAHSVTTFFEPLVVNHDPSRVEVHCFSNSTVVDDVTKRMKERVDHWHSLFGLSDIEADELVRKARIDVLIDLSGHTGKSRLSLFGRRPAPVQLTYLGYSSTSGLPAIDGLITDAVADPPGESDSHYTEKLLRLPRTFAVMRTPSSPPPVWPAPFRTTGHITLGSIAPIRKINRGVLDAWAAGMRAAPTARLTMIGSGFDEPAVRQRFVDELAARGVTSDRLEIIGHLAYSDYVAIHARIDLMLDTFPFSGHTTTVQNLYFGVPVVTYAGPSHRSRMSASVLTTIGLPELIAHSESEYGPLIARWANDPDGLESIRNGLRARIEASPLMDAKQFARDFEDLLIRAYETKLATGHV